jgi:hypothetical protein
VGTNRFMDTGLKQLILKKKKNIGLRTGVLAQVVQCLYKALCSKPSTSRKSLK